MVMKELYIVRHAKAENGGTLLKDIDRPLHASGYKEAYEMSGQLSKKISAVDLILSSVAVRAYSTAQLFARELGYPENKLQLRKEIYNAPAESIKNCIAEVDNSIHKMMLFGHNPGLSDLCYELGNELLGDLPTCAIVGISFNIKQWNEILYTKGIISLTMFPA